MAHRGDVWGMLGSLISSLIGGPLQAATALELAAKTSAYSFRAPPSSLVRANRCWPHPGYSVELTRGTRPVSLEHLLFFSRPRYKFEEGASRGTGSAECQVVDAVYSGSRDSLGDGDRPGGHIYDFAFERVARLPPLYPNGGFRYQLPV